MTHDRIVTPAHLLAAHSGLARIGATRALADLEAREPDLAEYLLEHLTDLHGRLQALGGPDRTTRRVYRHLERLVLVGLAAQRQAYCQLIDPADAQPGPGGPV